MAGRSFGSSRVVIDLRIAFNWECSCLLTHGAFALARLQRAANSSAKDQKSKL